MSEHARKSPSASSRWSKCAGSIREEEKYPNTSSPASIDGTGSHELLELLLADVIEDRMVNYVGETIGLGHEDKPEGWVVDESRLTRVMVAVDYVKQRMIDLGPNVLLLLEDRTHPGEKYGISDLWGTVDITLIINGFVEVIDYKDGIVKVSEHTEQLLCYASGQVDHAEKDCFEIKEVRKTIVQPKSFGEQIRSVSHTKEQNDLMFKVLSDAAILTDDPNAPLTSGDHCQWCKHKPNCSERNQLAFTAINFPVNPIDMTNEQLSKALNRIPMIRSLTESLEAEGKKRINKGEHIPGYEMVIGRNGNRTWIDEEEASKRIKGLTIKGNKLKQTERYISNLISPSAVLNLDLTKRQRETIEKLITRPLGVKKLTKVDQQKLADAEMFPEEIDFFSPEKGDIIAVSETFGKPLVGSFTGEKILKMTDKADGITATEFKQSDPDWTDDLLVEEGYAVWSDW